MNIEEIKRRVEEIRQLSGDDETAHSLEDDLYKALLEYICLNAPEPYGTMAAEALRTSEIPFARWCA